MGGNFGEESDEDSKEDLIDTREMGIYNTNEQAFNMMFSKLAPAKFVKRLTVMLREQDVEVKLDAKWWLMTFDVKQE
jgi:hypothetical protein